MAAQRYETGLAALDGLAERRKVPIVRPAVLDNGYGLGPRILFRLVRLFSGHSVPDAAKIMFYRPDFYGAPMKKLTHEVMRGRSAWSVGDRELMAAYLSKLNECPFCIGAHTATASRSYDDQGRVEAVLADLDTAPIEKPEGSNNSIGRPEVLETL